MNISKLVNEYARGNSPYMGQFVNHLPMGQLALYSLSKDLEKVEDYSKYYMEVSNIDEIQDLDIDVETIEEALGKRELYKPLLDYLNKIIVNENVDENISEILNNYSLGMSSGFFHTLIRLSFAVEGYRLEKEYLDEVKRSLAYYVTGYREADIFPREIEGSNIIEEMKKLNHDQEIKVLIEGHKSSGQKMKALYNSEYYLEKGFIIKGSAEEKIEAIQDLILSLFINSKDKGNILILHCITGLQALITLREYFVNFSKALDIMTTCIITHLMTLSHLNFEKLNIPGSLNFEEIVSTSIESRDVHTIKLTYSANKLNNLSPREDLKAAAYKRII